MNLHLLDTDTLTLFQKGNAAVCRRCGAAPPGSLAITVISVEEQFLGWYTRIRQAKADDELAMAYQGMTSFAEFVKQLHIVSFSKPAIQRYRQLTKLKTKISNKDLRIAAIALDVNATLVSRNLRDFKRVPNLHCVDWSK
jgi:tRNA(fMet)-specific endonuclease VapC